MVRKFIRLWRRKRKRDVFLIARPQEREVHLNGFWTLESWSRLKGWEIKRFEILFILVAILKWNLFASGALTSTWRPWNSREIVLSVPAIISWTSDILGQEMLKFLALKFKNQSINEVKPYEPQVKENTRFFWTPSAHRAHYCLWNHMHFKLWVV